MAGGSHWILRQEQSKKLTMSVQLSNSRQQQSKKLTVPVTVSHSKQLCEPYTKKVVSSIKNQAKLVQLSNKPTVSKVQNLDIKAQSILGPDHVAPLGFMTVC